MASPISTPSSKSVSNADAIAHLLPEEKAEVAAALQRKQLLQEQSSLSDLASFARAAWQVLEPGTELKWNWHLDLICEYLTLVRDRTIRRLIINVPPRTMKSRLVNVFYPTWSWSQIPTRRFLSSSYSGELSETFNAERAKVIRSEWFQSRWPGVVDLTRDTRSEIENTVGGKMTATSTGGTVTGKGAHDVIVDDPLKPDDANSDAARTNANDFFDQTLRTRLDDQVSGTFVIIMQRLHHHDLVGHIAEKYPNEYTVLSLPMEADKDERFEFPSGKRVIERKSGDLLWIDRFPRDVVESLKKMGSWAYAGQYQQRPTPLEGGIIKRDWLKFWRTLPTFDQVIQSWDMAFKATNDSSFVVGQVWGRKGADKYLLDEVRRKMEFPDSKKAVRALTEKWPAAYTILVEDKANGPAIIQSLKHEISGLIAVKADVSKEARLSAASPDAEAGNVYLPHPELKDEHGNLKYPWVEDWIEEVCAAPRAAFWDRADAFSQAINRLRQFPGGLTAFYQEQAEAAA